MENGPLTVHRIPSASSEALRRPQAAKPQGSRGAKAAPKKIATYLDPAFSVDRIEATIRATFDHDDDQIRRFAAHREDSRKAGDFVWALSYECVIRVLLARKYCGSRLWYESSYHWLERAGHQERLPPKRDRKKLKDTVFMNTLTTIRECLETRQDLSVFQVCKIMDNVEDILNQIDPVRANIAEARNSQSKTGTKAISRERLLPTVREWIARINKELDAYNAGDHNQPLIVEMLRCRVARKDANGNAFMRRYGMLQHVSHKIGARRAPVRTLLEWADHHPEYELGRLPPPSDRGRKKGK